jgi:hypothetical protein
VADGGAASVGESLLRLLVLELDIGRPETQFVVREGWRRAADARRTYAGSSIRNAPGSMCQERCRSGPNSSPSALQWNGWPLTVTRSPFR